QNPSNFFIRTAAIGIDSQATFSGPAHCVNPLNVSTVTYFLTVHVPDSAGGWDIGWARCCMPSQMTNLQNPQSEGVTFTAHIPGNGQCNEMNDFDGGFPWMVCVGETFTETFNITDPDGDSIVLEHVAPYSGLNVQGMGAADGQTFGSPPPIVNAFNVMGPPPYQGISIATGYAFNTPFGTTGISALTANHQWTFSAPSQGIFYVGIVAKEYRNGQLIAENFRYGPVWVSTPLNSEGPTPVELGFLSRNNAGEYTYHFPSTVRRPLSFRLYDLHGKVHFNTTQGPASQSNPLSIPTTDLPQGLYFLEITDGVHKRLEKLLVF
ncbi:MAG: T9SS type A sorting domain-containing protein, partial [Bacteroidota bacterium]